MTIYEFASNTKVEFQRQEPECMRAQKLGCNCNCNLT